MFGVSRQEALEKVFLKHIDKEEESFNHLIKTLDGIKEEIHRTNEAMIQNNAQQDLKLIEIKGEILNRVYTDMVLKAEYEKEIQHLNLKLTQQQIHNTEQFEKKVSKSMVQLSVTILVSVGLLIAWIIEQLTDFL